MKRSTKNLARIILIVCAALCAALILAQFAPFWTYTRASTSQKDTISILGYLITPTDIEYADLTNTLDTDVTTGSPKVIAPRAENLNALATAFCVVMGLGIVSIVFIVLKSNSLWISLFPFTVGCGSLICYLTSPAWKLGNSIVYYALLGLSGALTLCSLAVVAIWIYSMKFYFMDPKDWPCVNEK